MADEVLEAELALDAEEAELDELLAEVVVAELPVVVKLAEAAEAREDWKEFAEERTELAEEAADAAVPPVMANSAE